MTNDSKNINLGDLDNHLLNPPTKFDVSAKQKAKLLNMLNDKGEANAMKILDSIFNIFFKILEIEDNICKLNMEQDFIKYHDPLSIYALGEKDDDDSDTIDNTYCQLIDTKIIFQQQLDDIKNKYNFDDLEWREFHKGC